MPRPAHFHVDTVLYHPVEGKKLFPAGEQDPGPAWSEKEGGDPVGQATTTQALKDMIALQEQLEAKDRALTAKDHDLAQLAAAKAESDGKLADAEQRALDAEAARDLAEQTAAEVTQERDRAREVEAQLRARIAELEAEVAKVDGDGDGRVGGRKKKPADAPQDAA